eukprot:CAMPEP_0185755590 /NCGR_PEP_ID=MMETSP1174-20130828/14073_1 /TAXON_ID=35687 /ORGANISM="Dictyocha speculum, Strain CCMP1381" /LENGTH=73 /DNA_ID=CAMNT_0028434199 /DNA_START=495 /DNA_END=716 /DNA_ORIENTATION=-
MAPSPVLLTSTAESSSAEAEKEGQPVRASNLHPESKTFVPQPAHLYSPALKSFARGELSGGSVPPLRRTKYCE